MNWKYSLKAGCTGVLIFLILLLLDEIVPSGFFPSIFGIMIDIAGIPVNWLVKYLGVRKYPIPTRWIVYLILMIPYFFGLGVAIGASISKLRRLMAEEKNS